MSKVPTTYFGFCGILGVKFQIVKLQFILHSTSTEYENNLLFFYGFFFSIRCSLILRLMLLLDFINMSNLKIYFIEKLMRFLVQTHFKKLFYSI